MSFPCLDPLPSHQHVSVDGEVVAPRQDLAAVAVGEPLEVAKVSEQARLGRDGHVLRQVHQSAHPSVGVERTVGTMGRVGALPWALEQAIYSGVTLFSLVWANVVASQGKRLCGYRWLLYPCQALGMSLKNHTTYLEKVVAQLPRLYVRGADILAVQGPLEIEERRVSVMVLRPSPLDQGLLYARIPSRHHEHLTIKCVCTR